MRAMNDADISAVKAEALFVSPLQCSEVPGNGQVRDAIKLAIRAFGCRRRAERAAQRFGEHPETAGGRMRWAIA